MEVQGCSSHLSFGIIKNKNYMGEFAKPSNLKRAARLMYAINEIPEFADFSGEHKIDVILNATPRSEIFIHKSGFQNYLDCTITILYEKPAKTVSEKIKKFFKPVEKIEVRRSYIDEKALSDNLVKRFIRYIKSTEENSLKSRLRAIQDK